jgi:glucose/arabinose dehydrogenase
MRILPTLLCAAVFLAACGGDDSSESSAATTTAPEQAAPSSGRDRDANATPARLRTGTVVSNLDTPWEIAFLPDRTALVTERGGRVLRLNRDLRAARRPAAVVRVTQEGESGLLGLAIDPRFRSNRYVYLYRTTANDNEVLRYRYRSGRLSGGRVIVDGIPAAAFHDGGRLRFGPDGALWITTGEAGQEQLAQDPNSLGGKILRVANPRGGKVRPEIVSLGHRNVQGLDWQPGSGRLYASEFGPDANDELNEIVEGRNYGWPDAQGSAGPTPALIDWEDVIAPSGATFVRRSGSRWSGNLLVATLRGEHLRRITFDGDRVTRDQALYQGRYGRLRSVVEGPDGGIYLLTNNRDGRGSPRRGDDRIIRIVPPRS